MKVAIYCRVSTDDKGQNPERQFKGVSKTLNKISPVYYK
jgi:DNA invertase Pin-like site-specific DNA recombinase